MAVIILSATTVAENSIAGTVIGTLSVDGAKNNETFTYKLLGSFDDRFEIIGNQLVVKTGGSTLFDYESGRTFFTIEISAVSNASGDPTSVSDTFFDINVINNEAPTDITLSGASIAEHSANGTEIGALSAIDPDLNDTFTYTLTNDAEGRFAIVNGKLVVKDGAKLDYLTASSHQITVKVTDSDNNTFEKALTIGVIDALETYTGSAKSETLKGTDNAEFLDGGAGNDKIYGFGGNDIINGGLGKDILYGGAGQDTFVFDTKVKKGHFDQIKDFSVADDTIQLSLSAFSGYKTKGSSKKSGLDVFKKGKPDDKGGNGKKSVGFDEIFKKGKLEKKFFKIASEAKDSNDYIFYNKKTGVVYFDQDGAGGKKGIEILKVKPGTALTSADFLFI